MLIVLSVGNDEIYINKIFTNNLMNTYKNFHPPYNIKACEHFNNIMRTDNINIQH